jgi:hypothetical protein
VKQVSVPPTVVRQTFANLAKQVSVPLSVAVLGRAVLRWCWCWWGQPLAVYQKPGILVKQVSVPPTVVRQTFANLAKQVSVRAFAP